MAKDDIRPLRPADLTEALVLLTRLPVRMGRPRGATSAWAWPLVGIVIGALAGMVAGVALFLGLPLQIAGGLALATQIICTGAMHEDGLADCADGFWGGQDRDRRLGIMKDSQIGTYGVLALILSVGLRWQALVILMSYGHVFGPLLAAGVLSRAPMLVLMYAMPFARADGLARHVGQPGQNVMLIGVTAALIALLFTIGFWAIPLTIVVAMVTAGWGLLARAKIGGQTGDVLGAAQQLAEVAALLTLAALLW